MRIPIAYEPDYHTDTIGTYKRGQFLGCVVAGFRDRTIDNDWRSLKRWYAVLHRFDHDGDHVETEAKFAGTTADGEEAVIDRAREYLHDWLAGLPGMAFGDIAIKLFEITIDGIRFGLIDESDEDGEHVELYPNELGFDEPWDAQYDT